jgi:hypothetical protein
MILKLHHGYAGQHCRRWYSWNLILTCVIPNAGSQNISVSIVSGSKPRRLSLSPKRVKNFLFFKLPRWEMGPTQPPNWWVPVFFLGVKQLGCQAGPSPTVSTEVKRLGSIHPLLPMSSWHNASVGTCPQGRLYHSKCTWSYNWFSISSLAKQNTDEYTMTCYEYLETY